jgi:hypothetical protein
MGGFFFNRFRNENYRENQPIREKIIMKNGSVQTSEVDFCIEATKTF